ncbi:hypothetical protein FO519_003575 [Halicephalobus sp. NKZ332]|nr:hypothetical protein FO519_003575 [Halicephalobus sp. NKZ332]
MFILTLFFGVIPIKVMKYLMDKQRQSLLNNNNERQWPATVISFLTCFAGGVFLGIIFLDILPDANDALAYAQSHGTWNVDYPLVQLFALLGFFLVYFVEEISVAAFGEHSHGHDQTLVTQNPSIFNLNRVASENETKIESPRRRSTSNCEIHGQDKHSDDGTIAPEERKRAFIKSMTFTFALLVHASLEGFAFGVQSTDISILSLFFGIIVHKCIVAFSVGMRLVRCHPHNICFVITLIVIIAISSPLSGTLGTVLEDSNWDELTKNEISFILVSISMGTFLYIAFFEMMISRAVFNVSRLTARRVPAVQASRQVHKGVESVPPMRFMSIPERMGLYFFVAITFLSYPTYVMWNLDNLRPRPENSLGEEALAERESRLAAKGAKH